MFAVMVKYMDLLVKEIEYDFKQTVKTWEEQPAFTIRKSIGFARIKVSVTTDDEVYLWVSRGTEAHLITPLDPDGVLVYQEEYHPKTQIGLIEATEGGEEGDLVFSKYALHPGIEPRNFDVTIREKWEKVFALYLESMFREVAKSSGHALEVNLRFGSMARFRT
jgi:hypothetical protein